MNRFLLLGSIFANAILAFPTQPGSCRGGVPLDFSHITSTQIGTGPIEDGGFTFSIGGNRLTPGRKISAIQSAGGDEVRISGAMPFRGFLIRISGEGVDATNFLTAGTNSQQLLSLCMAQSAGGLGHVGNDQKLFADGLFRVPSSMNALTVEVTIVVSNRDSVSEWYMSTYSVDVLEAATFAPVISAPITPEPASAAPAPDPASLAPAAATTATPGFGTWAPNVAPDATTQFPVTTAPVPTQTGTTAPVFIGNIPFLNIFDTPTSAPLSPGSDLPTPSLIPTFSIAPNVAESVEPLPSLSASPDPTISTFPTPVPTMTSRPSSSFTPSTMGTTSFGPSSLIMSPSTTTSASSISPSTSPAPTTSFAPTMVQSGAPTTTTTPPSMLPNAVSDSSLPTMTESSVPTTIGSSTAPTFIPTLAPTKISFFDFRPASTSGSNGRCLVHILAIGVWLITMLCSL